MRRQFVNVWPLLVIFAVMPGRAWGGDFDAHRVTLQGQMVSVPTALADLGKQTGIVVEDRRKTKSAGAFKLDLKDVTFWQALDGIARAANARLSLYERDGVVALVDGPGIDVPGRLSYDGVFRVALRRMTAVHDLETGSRSLTASVEIAWEPHVRPFLLSTAIGSLAVKDEHNASLPAGAEGNSPVPVQGRVATTIDLRLPAAARSVTRLALVRGAFQVVAAGKMLTFTFGTLDALERGDSPRVIAQEGVTAKATKLKLADDVWTVEMALEYPPGGPRFESFQSWLVDNEASLIATEGDRRYPNNGGYANEGTSERRAVLSYSFIDDKQKGLARGKPGDWKLAYRTPGVIAEVPIRFEFKDVPLP
jgi:hypothetical protein